MVCGFSRYQERVSPNCAFLNGKHAFSALPAVLASEVGYTGRTVNQKRLASDSLICLVLQHFRWVSRGRCFSVKMSRTTARALRKC